jgi:hypothetical protein
LQGLSTIPNKNYVTVVTCKKIIYKPVKVEDRYVFSWVKNYGKERQRRRERYRDRVAGGGEERKRKHKP